MPKLVQHLSKLVQIGPNLSELPQHKLLFVSSKNPIYLHFFIHYSSIIPNLCCFGFQEQAKYWDVYPANVPSAIISDLEPGVEYSIDVMSINNMGESNFTLDPVIVRTSSKKIMLISVSTIHFNIAMGLKTFWSNIYRRFSVRNSKK